MKLLRMVLAAGMASSAGMAADREFSDVVQTISDQFGTHPMRIPLFGMINVFVAVARPAGAKHLDVAIFENLCRDRSRGNVVETIRGSVGAPWRRFIEVRSQNHGREDTIVYLRQEKDDWKLLLTSIEREQAVVVQIRLNPEGLRRWMAAPEESARHWSDR